MLSFSVHDCFIQERYKDFLPLLLTRSLCHRDDELQHRLLQFMGSARFSPSYGADARVQLVQWLLCPCLSVVEEHMSRGEQVGGQGFQTLGDPLPQTPNLESTVCMCL